jgi:PIN domain nuclease of toxin-antitoxin system
MATLTHLDTHVVVWLYLPRRDLLSQPAQEAIEEGELAVSPMVVLELSYLNEIGRLRVRGPEVVSSLQGQLGLSIDDTPFARVVDVAHDEDWTPDPFDRLIAAQATAARAAALVTADDTIRKNVPIALW